MPTLHIRKVPEDLYEHLQALAQLKQRSLNSQVIWMLRQAVEQEKLRSDQGKILAEIREQRHIYAGQAPDSVELLREDRGR